MSRTPKSIGLFIYFFILVTSFYHLFRFYEIFETDAESFVAFFVAFGFELAVLYFAYIYTKFRFDSSKVALALSLFIVWFGNVFVMMRNVHARTFEIDLLNIENVKMFLAFIGSVFLPIGSLFLGKIIASLDMEKEKVEKREITQEIKEEIETKAVQTDITVAVGNVSKAVQTDITVAVESIKEEEKQPLVEEVFKYPPFVESS